METTHRFWDCSTGCGINVRLLPAFLHSQVPAFVFNSSLSSPSSATLRHHHHPLPTPLPTSPLLSRTPKKFLYSRRKPITNAGFLYEDGDSGSSKTKVVEEVDSSFAVKRKAVEISPELKGASVFLVGINSTMKTRLGKLLADVLRYYHFDSDSLVEEAAGGTSAAKLFRERDEEGFRDSETEVLKQLSSMGRLVVCVGTGAVQSASNLALLRHGISIWIDVPLDIITRDIVGNGILLPESELCTQLTALYEEMRGGYATADATISLQKLAGQLGYDDLDAVTTEDMGLEVIKEIEKLMRVKKMMEAAARPF